MNELDKLAEEMYNEACLAQSKRMSPKKENHSPRDVGCEFKDLFDEPKNHYRSLAQWHLNKLKDYPANSY